MDTPIETFAAVRSADEMALWVSLLLGLAAIVATVLLLRRKSGDSRQRNLTVLLAMLAFFGAMISLSTAFFSAWSMKKTGPVHLYDNAIETPYGRVALDGIGRVYMQEEGRGSLIGGKASGKRIKLLMIEEVGGKMHVLSEENYDINRIVGRLKEAQERKKE